MAAGMVNIGKRGGVASCSYILRNKECESFLSNMGMEKIEILHLVKTYIDIEKSGSKELSIRANANPKLMTKLILSLPNENSTEENLEYLKNVLEEMGIIDYPYILAIHRGEKDGILNKHAHINFFERKFEKGNSNKNRLFNAKDFVLQVLTKYQKIFGLTPNEEIRERIPRIEFQEHADALKEIDIVNKEIISLDKEITYERRLAAVETLMEEDKIEAAAETENLEFLPFEITELPVVEIFITETTPVIKNEPVEIAEEIQPIENIELAQIKILDPETTPVIQVNELVEAAEEVQLIENIELAQIEMLETETITAIQVNESVAAEEVQLLENIELAPVEMLETKPTPVIQVDELVKAAEEIQLIENIELAQIEMLETETTPVIKNEPVEIAEEVQLIENIDLAPVEILKPEPTLVIQVDELVEAAEEIQLIENIDLATVEILETKPTPVIQVDELVKAAEEIQLIENIELAQIEMLETETTPVIKNEPVEIAEEVQPIENIDLPPVEILKPEPTLVIQVDELVEAAEEIQLIENIDLATVEILETKPTPVIQVDELVKAAEEIQLIENIDLAQIEMPETESVQEIQTENDGRFRRSTFSDTETDKTEPKINPKPNRGNSDSFDTELPERDIIEPRIGHYEPSGNNEGDAVDETGQQKDVGIDKQHGQISVSDFKRTKPDIEAEPANARVQDIAEHRVKSTDLEENDGRTVRNAKINRARTKTPEIVPDRDDDDDNDEPKKRKKGLRL